MKKLFRLLFPTAVSRADLTTVERDLGGDINRLRARICVLENLIQIACDAADSAKGRAYLAEGLIDETNERITAIEREAKARADVLSHAIYSANTAAAAASTLVRNGKLTPNQTRAALDLAPMPKGDDKFESLPISEGRAVRTKVMKLDPTKGPKGREPKGGPK